MSITEKIGAFIDGIIPGPSNMPIGMEVDKAINAAIDQGRIVLEPPDSTRTGNIRVARIDGTKLYIWIGNYPYAFGSINDPLTGYLPRRKTRRRLAAHINSIRPVDCKPINRFRPCLQFSSKAATR